MYVQTSFKFFQYIFSIFIATVLFVFTTNEKSVSLSNKTSKTEMASSMLNMRSAIKQYIDELFKFDVASVEHTTDSVAQPPKKRLPDKPKQFDAGRFKVMFVKGAEIKALICQTENKVGHIAKVIPGKTDIGGYVQILDDPSKDFISGSTLNDSEVDYFVQMLYRKFSKPLTDDEEILLNKVKDISLAILFSGKPGIDEYHNNQIKKLKAYNQF